MPQVTRREIEAAFASVHAVAEAIRELGEVPSGVLYAQVMGSLSLESYHKVIGVLTSAGLVRESNHVLTWIGPAKGESR